MDQLLSYLPPPLLDFIETRGSCLTAEHAQWAGVALVSLAAVYAGYLYMLCLKEAAVSFNVPLPAEVRNSAGGRKWDEVTGVEKRVLEDQVRGVSYSYRGSFAAVGIVI
jgi:hypothetical protein